MVKDDKDGAESTYFWPDRKHLGAEKSLEPSEYLTGFTPVAVPGLPVGKHLAIYALNPAKCISSGLWNGKPCPRLWKSWRHSGVGGISAVGYVKVRLVNRSGYRLCIYILFKRYFYLYMILVITTY